MIVEFVLTWVLVLVITIGMSIGWIASLLLDMWQKYVPMLLLKIKMDRFRLGFHVSFVLEDLRRLRKYKGVIMERAALKELMYGAIEEMMKNAPNEIQQQMADNIQWIKGAQENKLVVGSQARILYADSEGRIKIAEAFNQAIARGEIGAVILGRDHHDVSGTDSPYRETSNIYDGSRFTADMAIQNVIGDSFRGATWVSIHNGGGVGWGEVINGGFGMLLDGTAEASRRLESMLFWDVNNGISRRSWARNEGAIFAIKRAMQTQPLLQVTIPNLVDDSLF